LGGVAEVRPCETGWSNTRQENTVPIISTAIVLSSFCDANFPITKVKTWNKDKQRPHWILCRGTWGLKDNETIVNYTRMRKT
jgi:hypothetical protein